MDEPGAIPHVTVDDKRRLTRGTRIRLPTRENRVTPPMEEKGHAWWC